MERTSAKFYSRLTSRRSSGFEQVAEKIIKKGEIHTPVINTPGTSLERKISHSRKESLGIKINVGLAAKPLVLHPHNVQSGHQVVQTAFSNPAANKKASLLSKPLEEKPTSIHYIKLSPKIFSKPYFAKRIVKLNNDVHASIRKEIEGFPIQIGKEKSTDGYN